MNHEPNGSLRNSNLDTNFIIDSTTLTHNSTVFKNFFLNFFPIKKREISHLIFKTFILLLELEVNNQEEKWNLKADFEEQQLGYLNNRGTERNDKNYSSL